MFEAEPPMAATAQVLDAVLRPLAGTLLGTGFEVECQAVVINAPLPPGGLPPELLGAGERRKATFCAGRACACRALEALGFPSGPIRFGAVGAPRWPAGLVGSISHTDDLAAAVVAHAPPISGLGLDVEEDGGLDDPQMCDLVCRPDELHEQGASDDLTRLRFGKLLFVIKEAVYKLHRPLGGAFLEFHDLRVSLHPSHGRFHAELMAPGKQGGAGCAFGGAFALDHGLIVALAALSGLESSPKP